MTENLQIQPVDIRIKIHTIRNQKVIDDFMFQLSSIEVANLQGRKLRP
ncbi:MAG: hypothetical protein Q7J05_01560 [Paludibacter sp.]|nr:hypothetical protein [Paludibacter sp.]